MGACHITLVAGGEVCEHRRSTVHSFPQPAGYLQGWWQVLQAGMPLKSMAPAQRAPQAPQSGQEGNVCTGSHSSKSSRSTSQPGLHQLGRDQQPFPIPNADSHHLSAFL